MLANCEEFTVTLQNRAHGEVKVTKFEYKDGSTWKAENMFGLDGHQKIEKDHGFAFKRDLEGVGNECTQFRVTYQHHIGGTKWGDSRCEVTEVFMAEDKDKKTATLTA